MRSILAAVIAAVLILPGGCSKSTAARVSGKVTYKNQPVGGATLNLLNKQKGSAAMAALDESGLFRIEEPMESGTYTVYLTSASAEPSKPGSKPTNTSKPAVIPKHARDAMSSKASVTINPGDNVVTIELTD